MDIILERHPNITPYTSGLYKSDMSFADMQKLVPYLTEEEKLSPWAKYYGRPAAELQPHMKEALSKEPLPPSECCMPDEIGKKFLQNDMPDSGYGVLENGAGYACFVTDYTDITDEMITTYVENFAHDENNRNLFYKIWSPGDHLIHFEDAIIESWGWGYYLTDMNMPAFSFSKMGISEAEIRSLRPDCFRFLGAGGHTVNLYCPKERTRAIMIQIQVETEYGSRRYTFYWWGVDFGNENSPFIIDVNADPDTMAMRMRYMMRHGMQEACNEIELIKEFSKINGK